MHIEVATATQKLAGNKTRKLFPQEIDWLLNKNMQRFVQSRVTPKKDGSGGYEIDAFNTDAIRMLMRTGVEIPAYIADARRYKSVLPGDYDYMISDEAVIKQPGVAEVPVKSTITEHLLLISINKSTLVNGPWYNSVTLTLNGGVAFNIQGYAAANNSTFTGFNSSDEIYEVTSAMMGVLAGIGWRAYWEYYGTLYLPRTLIIATGAVTATGSILIDGVTRAGVQQTITLQANDYPDQPTRDQTNRLTASHLVDNLREVAFYRTQPESPLSTLSGNLLHVYANETFIVTSTRLSYVRKPRRISLILGQDCELAPSVHQLVCDLTVEYYKNIIADPTWETKLKDNMVRTPV